MQLKYNRQPGFGSTIIRNLIKLLLAAIVFIIVIFLVEKITFPSPENNYEIDVTNEIKKL
jgi:hypothetical protein